MVSQTERARKPSKRASQIRAVRGVAAGRIARCIVKRDCAGFRFAARSVRIAERVEVDAGRQSRGEAIGAHGVQLPKSLIRTEEEQLVLLVRTAERSTEHILIQGFRFVGGADAILV